MNEANEILCLDSDDQILAILRYYNWNVVKLQDEWFDK